MLLRRKKCVKCGKLKPATAKYFSPRSDRRKGLKARCIRCLDAIQDKASYESALDRKRSASRRNQDTFRTRRPENRLLSQAKDRSSNKGVPFDLVVEDIQIPTHCPYLGIPLVTYVGKGRGHLDAPSLDRIDPTKGYVRGNVEVISYKANMIKSFGTAEEHEKIATRMRKLAVSGT